MEEVSAWEHARSLALLTVLETDRAFRVLECALAVFDAVFLREREFLELGEKGTGGWGAAPVLAVLRREQLEDLEMKALDVIGVELKGSDDVEDVVSGFDDLSHLIDPRDGRFILASGWLRPPSSV